MFNKLLVVSGVVAGVLLFGTGVSADTRTDEVDFKVNAGEFSITTSDIDSFGDITLLDESKEYKTSFANKFTVKDLRGSQAGWKLDVKASQFKDGDNNLLPLGSLKLDPVKSVTRVGTGEGSVPTVSTGVGEVIDGDGVTVLSASKGNGMGVFDVSYDTGALELTIDPTTTKINDGSTVYKSVLTWNLLQAP